MPVRNKSGSARSLEPNSALDEVDPLVEECVFQIKLAKEKFENCISEHKWPEGLRALLGVCKVTQSLRLDVGPLNRLDTDSRKLFAKEITKFVGHVEKRAEALVKNLPREKRRVDSAIANIKERLSESKQNTIANEVGVETFLNGIPKNRPTAEQTRRPIKRVVRKIRLA